MKFDWSYYKRKNLSKYTKTATSKLVPGPFVFQKN